MEHFLGTIVQVRGVVYAYHDMDRHLTDVRIIVSSQQFISVEAPAPDDPFLAPAIHVRDLFTYNPDESTFRRVNVIGQVVYMRNDTCYAMDGTNGFKLISTDGTKPNIGDMIEAVGFPGILSPFNQPLLTLRDAIIRKTGKAPLPAAIKIAPEDLLNQDHDSTLVQLESRLLGISLYPAEQVLELQSGTHVYRARLNTAFGQIPPLRAGSLLQLTGVYAVSEATLARRVERFARRPFTKSNLEFDTIETQAKNIYHSCEI